MKIKEASPKALVRLLYYTIDKPILNDWIISKYGFGRYAILEVMDDGLISDVSLPLKQSDLIIIKLQNSLKTTLQISHTADLKRYGELLFLTREIILESIV